MATFVYNDLEELISELERYARLGHKTIYYDNPHQLRIGFLDESTGVNHVIGIGRLKRCQNRELREQVADANKRVILFLNPKNHTPSSFSYDGVAHEVPVFYQSEISLEVE